MNNLRKTKSAGLSLGGVALVLAHLSSAIAADIVVGPGGEVETIGAALERAVDGDRIVVLAGVYVESGLVIDKRVMLIGDGRPIIDGAGEQIITIASNDVAVSGFLLRNVAVSYVEDRAAIKTDGVSGCAITDNQIRDTFFGIYLARTSHCRVAHNIVTGSAGKETAAGNGIHLWYSRWVTVDSNLVDGHRDGIYFEFVEDSEITGNQSTNNLRYGLHFMFSDRCTYRGNLFRTNGAGVAVMYTEHVEMIDNRFEENWGSAAYGVLLKDINDSHIVGNHFLGNSIGLYAEGSSRMSVERNVFSRNGWAVKIMANAIDNTFTENDFLDNTFDVATNSRQHFSTFEGNFWDAYRGYDLDRDGFGDIPHRPVRLFSVVAERNEPLLILLRSVFVRVMDAAEQVFPMLTPDSLIDAKPSLKRFS